MGVRTFDAKGIAGLALFTLALYFLVIVISFMTIVKPTRASGLVPTTNTYLVSGHYENAVDAGTTCDMVAFWDGYTSHAVVTVLNAAKQYYQCTFTYLANTTLQSSYWGTALNYYAQYEHRSCPAHSSLTGAACTCNANFKPDATQLACVATHASIGPKNVGASRIHRPGKWPVEDNNGLTLARSSRENWMPPSSHSDHQENCGSMTAFCQQAETRLQAA